jgi:hypothetical protein
LNFSKEKEIWQTIQIKIKSSLRSNGAFSRGTGSAGRDMKSSEEGNWGQTCPVSEGSSAFNNKMEQL